MPTQPNQDTDSSPPRWVHFFETKIGWTYLEFASTAVTRLSFGFPDRTRAIENWQAYAQRDIDATDTSGSSIAPPQFASRWIDKIETFCAGTPTDLKDIPIETSHLTKFGMAVTEACREIDWGQTASYKHLAEVAGSPNASRAVGGIMAKNRFPLIVPCHRIMASNGKLTGFSAPGGLTTKELLLAAEAAVPTFPIRK